MQVARLLGSVGTSREELVDERGRLAFEPRLSSIASLADVPPQGPRVPHSENECGDDERHQGKPEAERNEPGHVIVRHHSVVSVQCSSSRHRGQSSFCDLSSFAANGGAL